MVIRLRQFTLTLDEGYGRFNKRAKIPSGEIISKKDQLMREVNRKILDTAYSKGIDTASTAQYSLLDN